MAREAGDGDRRGAAQVNQHDADKLIETIRSLVAPTAAPASGKVKIEPKANPPAALERTQREATGNMGEHIAPFDDAATERQYQAFKNRLIEEATIDPVLLHLLTVRPEIVVEVERKIENIDGGTMRGRCASLIAQGWFDQERATSAVRAELTRTGADPGGGGTLGTRLSELQRAGFLTLSGKGWIKAPGVKVTERTIEK